MQVVIKHICVPTDFSEAGDHAVRYGAALAQHFGADLHILHVLQEINEKLTNPDFTSEGSTVKEFLKALESGATEYLARLHTQLSEKKGFEGVTVYKNYLHGAPHEQITRYALKHMIDLLVLGTHGRSGLSHLLLGSVAEKVVRTAPCPVLTVRHPNHQFIVDEKTVGDGPRD